MQTIRINEQETEDLLRVWEAHPAPIRRGEIGAGSPFQEIGSRLRDDYRR